MVKVMVVTLVISLSVMMLNLNLVVEGLEIWHSPTFAIMVT